MSQITTKIIVSEKDGAVVGEFILQQGEHLIGRTADCSIKLKSDHVSREHARLNIGGDTLEIEDLDSSWGTFLDNVQITGRTTMKPTQKLRISDLNFDIEIQSLAKMGPTKAEDLPKSVLIPGGGVAEDSQVEEESTEAEEVDSDAVEPDKELELDPFEKTEKISARKNNKKLTRNIGITVAGILVLGFLLWSFEFRAPTAEPRSQNEIFLERESLPALFLTEKTMKRVTAPGNKQFFIDKESKEICWRTMTCINPKCSVLKSGGEPPIFINPNVSVFIKPDGTIGQDHVRAMKAAKAGPLIACPECLKTRNVKNESRDSKEKYLSWVQPYVLPETAKRIKELEAEQKSRTELDNAN